MSNIAYIRVSSTDQNTSRQEELFKSYNIDKYYIEKVSGKNIKDRPELQKMMDYVREGDVVYVESISRFGRSLQDLLTLINQLNEKGVQFKSL
ncbi:MAG: recombinase family protein [Erysipelotrichaceae bacterium]|nr:recombinase family protein [Erysipelotrichaceae bacterium]